MICFQLSFDLYSDLWRWK